MPHTPSIGSGGCGVVGRRVGSGGEAGAYVGWWSWGLAEAEEAATSNWSGASTSMGIQLAVFLNYFRRQWRIRCQRRDTEPGVPPALPTASKTPRSTEHRQQWQLPAAPARPPPARAARGRRSARPGRPRPSPTARESRPATGPYCHAGGSPPRRPAATEWHCWARTATAATPRPRRMRPLSRFRGLAGRAPVCL